MNNFCSFPFSLVPDEPPNLQCADMCVADCEPTRYSQCTAYVPYNNRLCLEEHQVDARGVS